MPLFSRNEPAAGGIPTPTYDRWRPALDAVLRVSELAASGAPVADSLQGTLKIAVELLRAQQGSLMAVTDDGQTLVLVASVGLSGDVGIGQRVLVGDSVAGRVLATGRPLLLGDSQDQFAELTPRHRTISSSVVVPLRSGGRAIGVLSLAISDSPAMFTEDDLRLAQMFADQAAGILDRSKDGERSQRVAGSLAELAKATSALANPADLDQLLHQVLEGGLGLVGGIEGFSCLFDPGSGSMTRGVFRGIDKTTIRNLLELEELKKAVAGSSVTFAPEAGVVALGLSGVNVSTGVLVVRSTLVPSAETKELLTLFGAACDAALTSLENQRKATHSRAELDSILTGVPNPIILVDDKRRLISANPAAETLFGLSSIFSSGDAIQGRLGNESVEQLLMATGKMIDEITAGNPPRAFKVRLTDITLPEASVGRVLVMDDVTEEREIAQTQRDFVAMIGHELRTPLTLVKGFARTLLKRAEKGPLSVDDARDALTTIDARAGQLERLIEDLLYVSKIETREATLRIESVNVREMILAAIDDLRHDYTDRKIDLESPELQWSCDEMKVALVIRHIIENALKYSEPPDVVQVRVTEDTDELLIEVMDRGMGILSADIPHIFDRFRQVDGSSTRSHGGTGVGLYLCSKLIAMLGGRIWVDSTWGKGSTFSIALPRRVTSTIGEAAVTASPATSAP